MHVTVLTTLTPARGLTPEPTGSSRSHAATDQPDFADILGNDRGKGASVNDPGQLPVSSVTADQTSKSDQDAATEASDQPNKSGQGVATELGAKGSEQGGEESNLVSALDTAKDQSQGADMPPKRGQSMHETVAHAMLSQVRRDASSTEAGMPTGQQTTVSPQTENKSQADNPGGVGATSPETVRFGTLGSHQTTPTAQGTAKQGTTQPTNAADGQQEARQSVFPEARFEKEETVQANASKGKTDALTAQGLQADVKPATLAPDARLRTGRTESGATSNPAHPVGNQANASPKTAPISSSEAPTFERNTSSLQGQAAANAFGSFIDEKGAANPTASSRFEDNQRGRHPEAVAPTGQPTQGTAAQKPTADAQSKVRVASPAIAHSAERTARQTTEIMEELSWDVRPHGASTATAAQTIHARPELPPHVAQQIAQALHRAADRPLEIALNPAELGRVRMTLATTETGIVVNIVAERTDTLDLMRRNIDDLGHSFEDLGYEDIAFAFGQNGDASQDAHSGDPVPVKLDLLEQEQLPQPTPNVPTRLAIAVEGVDIRL